MDLASTAAQLPRLQSVLRPNASESVVQQLWVCFGFFVVSATLHFATLCYKLLKSSKNDLWLMRKNASGDGGFYIISNSLLLWLPLATTYSIICAYQMWFFVEINDGETEQYNMIAMSILPSIPVILASFPVSQSILFSSLESSRSLARLVSSRTFRFFPPRLLWNLATFLLPVGFFTSILVTALIANSRWNTAIDAAEILLDKVQNMNLANLTVEDIQIMTSKGMFFESESQRANIMASTSGYIWDSFVTLFLCIFLPSSIMVILVLKRAIYNATSLAGGSSSNLVVPRNGSNGLRSFRPIRHKQHSSITEAERKHKLLISFVLLVVFWCLSECVVAWIRINNTVTNHEPEFATDYYFRLHVIAPSFLTALFSTLVGVVLLLRTIPMAWTRRGRSHSSSGLSSLGSKYISTPATMSVIESRVVDLPQVQLSDFKEVKNVRISQAEKVNVRFSQVERIYHQPQVIRTLPGMPKEEERLQDEKEKAHADLLRQLSK